MVHKSLKKVSRDNILAIPKKIFLSRENYKGVFPKGWYLRYFHFVEIENKNFREELCAVFNTDYLYFIPLDEFQQPYVYQIDYYTDNKELGDFIEKEGHFSDNIYVFDDTGSWGIFINFDIEITLIGSKESVTVPFNTLEEFETKQELLDHLAIFVDINNFAIDWEVAS